MNRPGTFFKNATQTYAFAGFMFGLLFPVIATVVRILSMGIAISPSNMALVQSTDRLLWIIDTAPIFLGLFASLAGYRQDMLQKANSELLLTEKELRSIQNALEQRVEQRTVELTHANQRSEKHTEQLKTIAEIARAVITNQFIDELLRQFANLISSRFGFYHVGIFLLDERKEFAILRASNSEGGQKMLARSHRLKVGEQGIVGHVASSGNPRIALNVGEDVAFFNNPDLPETQSEVTLPLKFGPEIIGALDIQSQEKNAFTQDDIVIFAILADQVSVGIQNARSSEQARRALQEAVQATSQLTGRSWQEHTGGIRIRGYRYDGIRPEPVHRASRAPEEKDTFTVPVEIRGQTIGRLKLRTPDASRKWNEDELAIIESTAERVALALEGARLLDDAQKRASRETFLSELSAKLGTSFQMDSILRDTVEELGQALKGTTVTFQLVNPSAAATEDDGGFESRNKPE